MLSISSLVIPTCACLGSGGGTMALWSSVTVLVAHPATSSQLAIASKNTFFIARNIGPCAVIAPGKEHVAVCVYLCVAEVKRPTNEPLRHKGTE
jgi:hypothetical protein